MQHKTFVNYFSGFFIGLCLFSGSQIRAQDGITPIIDNLNNLDEATLARCAAFNGNGDLLSAVIIDSTTDLSRIPLLKAFSELRINLEKNAFPVELNSTALPNLRRLTIDGENKPHDLSNIKKLSQLESLSLIDCSEIILTSSITSLAALRDIYISSPTISNIDALTKISTLRSLVLSASPAITALPAFPPDNKINSVALYDLNPHFSIGNLKTLGALRELVTNGISYASIPGNLPVELEKLIIDSDSSLVDVKNLSRYTHLRSLMIRRAPLEKINADLSGLTDTVQILLSADSRLNDVDAALRCRYIYKAELEYLPALKQVHLDPGSSIMMLYITNTGLTQLPDKELMKKIPVIQITDNKQLHTANIKSNDSDRSVIIDNNAE